MLSDVTSWAAGAPASPWSALSRAAGAEIWRPRWPELWTSPGFLFKPQNKKIRIGSKYLDDETWGHCKDFGVMCNTTCRAASPTVVFVMQHSSQAESHGFRSAAACTAVQQPHTQRKGYECSICKTVWTFQSFCTRCPNVFSGYIFRG